MRTRISLFPTVLAILMASLLVTTDATPKGRDFHGSTNENSVKKACGGDLQTGGGAFGCTKCDTKGCTDWSCNRSGKGRQGCWIEPVGRTVPGRGKGGKGGEGFGNPVSGTRGVDADRRKGLRGAAPAAAGLPIGTSRDHRRQGGSAASAQGGVLVDGQEGNIVTGPRCGHGGCRPVSVLSGPNWQNVNKRHFHDHRSR